MRLLFIHSRTGIAMATAMNPQTMVLLAVIPLVMWRMYSRMKRLIGRQLSRPWRHWGAVLFIPALLAFFGLLASKNMTAVLSLVAGIVAGAALAVYGLHLTRFEKTNEGMFYTPNSQIGIGLTVLFVGRLIYRFTEIAMAGGFAARGTDADFARHPLTLVIVGLMFAYYLTYASGLLRWRAGKLAIGTHF
jgi:hypothetical protein